MDQKWLMLVIDGSKSMGPHWPRIFTIYVEKIVRHYRLMWKEEPNANHRVEFGLLMYNVKQGDTECPVEGSYWTGNEDEFLKKLSNLTFKGTETSSNLFTVEALAEALVMFPKPPIGKESREYYKGERHCLVVEATEPSNRRNHVNLPKIKGGQLFGSHTLSSMSNCDDVAELYVKLGVSLSVISPKLCPGWRTIFGQANKIPAESEDNEVTFGKVSILIAPKFKLATEAITGFYTLFPPFPEEERSFLLSSIDGGVEPAANNSHQNTNVTPTQTLQSPGLYNPQGSFSSPFVSLNSRAYGDDAITAAYLNAQSFTYETPNNNVSPTTNYWMSLLNSSSHNNVISEAIVPAESNNGNNYYGNNNGVSASSSSRRQKRAPAGSDGRGTKARRGRRRQRMTSDMDSIPHNKDPFLIPLQSNPFHVICWQGGISIGKPGDFKLIAHAKAYRRRTTDQTISQGWPIWLHISDFVSHNALSAIRLSQSWIDDVNIEMLKMDKDKLFEFLTTRSLFAKVYLPSQTLILTPTSQPSRFIGTLFEGRGGRIQEV